jgi:hypothetical protein
MVFDSPRLPDYIFSNPNFWLKSASAGLGGDVAAI